MAASIILLSAFAVVLVLLAAVVAVRRDRKTATEKHLAGVLCDLENGRVEDAKVLLHAILAKSKNAWI